MTASVQVLDRYQALLEKLGETERGRLQRSMGMKMEQLKARRLPFIIGNTKQMCCSKSVHVPSETVLVAAITAGRC